MAPSVRELPPTRLAVNITSPAGQSTRWGRDERRPENVPGALSFSSTAPGGFEAFSCTLPRKAELAYPDLARLSNVNVSGACGTAWEGRLEGAPRVAGTEMAVSPSAVGWQAHLEDDKSAKVIYVDRDLSHWATAPSYQRQLAIQPTGGIYYKISGGSADVQPDDTGTPAVRLAITEMVNTASERNIAETWYNANGCPIGSVYYDYRDRDNAGAALNTTWVSAMLLSPDDVGIATFDSSGDLANSAVTGTLTAAAGNRVWAFVQLYFASTLALTGSEWKAWWRRLTVWGNHGLTKRGTAPDDGVYASDAIAHALSAWAPLIRYTTGANGTIASSNFILPQLTFTDPTTAAEIIAGANRFHLWDWLIYEGQRPGEPTFYYHERGARGRAWRARIGPSRLTEAGPQIDRLWNGVLVRYQDVDGTTKTVGPTGADVNTTSADLLDTDPLNPANQLGIRRWQVLDMNGVSTAVGAIEVGSRFLEQSRSLELSGQAQITGYVEDDRGVTWPAWRIRAGDTISFVDASDTSPRRIVRANYTDDGRTCTVDLDAPPDGLAALLERLQVVLVPLGL